MVGETGPIAWTSVGGAVAVGEKVSYATLWRLHDSMVRWLVP